MTPFYKPTVAGRFQEILTYDKEGKLDYIELTREELGKVQNDPRCKGLAMSNSSRQWGSLKWEMYRDIRTCELRDVKIFLKEDE